MTPKINASIEGADNPEDAGKIRCWEPITEEMRVAEEKLNEGLVVQLMAIGVGEGIEVDVVDEDWLSGVSCNPDEPEMCESCQ